MLRVFSAMFGACVAAAVGQILVRRGMLQVGELAGHAPRYLVLYFWRALTNPWVIGGTVGNALFYFLFLAALSWADVSVALPLTAMEYVMAAVLGILFLGERVPPLRWAGISLVVAGVLVIGVDQHRAGAKGAPPAPPGVGEAASGAVNGAAERVVPGDGDQEGFRRRRNLDNGD